MLQTSVSFGKRHCGIANVTRDRDLPRLAHCTRQELRNPQQLRAVRSRICRGAPLEHATIAVFPVPEDAFDRRNRTYGRVIHWQEIHNRPTP